MNKVVRLTVAGAALELIKNRTNFPFHPLIHKSSGTLSGGQGNNPDLASQSTRICMHKLVRTN